MTHRKHYGGDKWVAYNPTTDTYDTKDGTHVAAELVENVECLADVLHIANIRGEQRKTNGKEQKP